MKARDFFVKIRDTFTNPRIMVPLSFGLFFVVLLDYIYVSDNDSYNSINLTWWGWLAITPHLSFLAYAVIRFIIFGLIIEPIKRAIK